MIYHWKENTRFPVAAQVAGERLEFLRREHGAVTAPIVLNDARAETSPLHKCFEWDDATAAERHRVHQARVLLERIVCVVTVDGGVPVETRAFVSIALPETGREYLPAQVALDDPETRGQIAQDALMDLQRWVLKYSHIPELRGAIQKVKGALGSARQVGARSV